MRLTLRTLLAYLDDILEPAEAREIGQKLQESSVASSLVSRIREVVRRRRLTAPTVSGSGMGIDPNLVAEYLDNTLPPEGIADVEKICLESDVHLAEVAACHQVLTLALGEPVEIHPETRERMYALGPNTQRMHLEMPVALLDDRSAVVPLNGERSQATVEKEVERRALREAAAAVSVAASAPADPVPSYRRPASFWSRALVPAVLVVVLVGWGILAFQNSPFWTGREKAGQSGNESTVALDAAPRRQQAIAATDEPKESQPASHDIASATSTVNRPQEKPSRDVSRTESIPTTGIDLPVPPDAPETTGPRKPFVRGAAKTESVSEETTVATRPPVSAEPPTPAPAAMPTISVKYSSPDGVVLHYAPRDQNWLLLPRRALLHRNDIIAVPEPFECRLDLDDGRAQVTLQSRSAARMLPPQEPTEFGIELQRGQIVVRQGTSGGKEAEDPIRYSIAIHGEVWNVELTQPDTVLGVEVLPREPEKFETSPEEPYGAAIYLMTGAARVTDRAGMERVLKAPVWFPLPAKAADEKTSAETAEATPLLAIPKWLAGFALSPTEKQYKTLFEKRFDPSEAVEMSIPAVASDPNPAIARLATECLALIEAVDPLISVLQRSPHEECRKAAIVGLRLWLPKSAENRDKLKSELAMRFPPAEGDAVYQLLWGYSADDARDRNVSQQLLDWMGHSEVSIRELAFYHVFRLTDKRHEYRPNATPLQMQSSLNRWRQHMAKEGALLPPKPADKMP